MVTQYPLIFVECHYYSSGLKSVFCGGEPRPKWLPAIDSVGLHNEVELKGDDYAVDFTRFELEDRKLSWLAVYKCSKDQDYGDRGNYCGVGIWFVDSFPTYPTKILGGLSKLCSLIQEFGINPEFEQNLEGFLDFVQPFLNPAQWLPSFVVGMRYGKVSSYSVTAYVRLPEGVALGVLSTAVQRLMFSSKELPYNRMVFWAVREGKVKVDQVQELEALEDFVNLEAFTAGVLRQNSGINDLEFQLRSEKKVLELDNDRLQRAVESFQREIVSLNQAKFDQEQAISALRTQNEDLRFAQSRRDHRADAGFGPLEQKKDVRTREHHDRSSRSEGSIRNSSGDLSLAKDVQHMKRLVIEIRELVDPTARVLSFKEVFLAMKSSRGLWALCALIVFLCVVAAVISLGGPGDTIDPSTKEAPVTENLELQPASS